MKHTWMLLAILVLTALMATPVLAAGNPSEGIGPGARAPLATITATATLTATATTVPTLTPQPTYTPLPTYTPFPTYTPLAAPTAAPAAPAATVAPTAGPTVEPSSPPPVQVGGNEGKVVFGGTYTLGSGERLGGDLVVFGGTATLQEGSRVDGNLALIGGVADVAGRVTGDMVLVGGSAHLRSSAEVDGQLVRVGGSLDRDPGAQIRGGESGGAGIPPIPPVPAVPVTPLPQRGANLFLSFFSYVMRVILTTVLLALAALFVVSLWRQPFERVSQTIVSAPAASWGVGFLTALTFAVLVVPFAIVSGILTIICIGLLGFGIIAAASFALAVAALAGWIALGMLVGDRLLRLLGSRSFTPAGAAVIGTAAITFIWVAFEPACGLGWLFFALLAPLGLGAVVLTRFGTQNYPTIGAVPPAPPAYPVSPAPPAPLAPAPEAAPAAEPGAEATPPSVPPTQP